MNIRHFSFGSGKKTMVVVPGLTIGYVTDFVPEIEAALSLFADEYTVYLFDIRDDVPENYTLRQMGEDLVSTIKSMGLEHIYLYGCSMGGMESMYIAGTYPELVEKLVVAASSCKGNAMSDAVVSNWIQLATDRKYHELTHNMGKLIYSKNFYESNVDAFSLKADRLTDEIVDRFINTASAIPGMDLTKQASEIRCPVLVLGSKGDKVLGADASVKIAEITGGELYLFGEEYPHAVFDEAPELRTRAKAFFDAE